MTTMYLTNEDLQNYGSDLIDVTQRAALQAVAPHLQRLEGENAELQRRLAQEARRRLDRDVAEAVPDLHQIDADPRWHRWLLQLDELAGVPRQKLLDDAVRQGDPRRVKAFFDGFRRAHGAAAEPTSHTSTNRRRPTNYGKPVYSREQIAQLFDQHRRGAYRGREAEWRALEHSIIAAGAEGRILGGVDVAGK
jgi:hypothetical protein